VGGATTGLGTNPCILPERREGAPGFEQPLDADGLLVGENPIIRLWGGCGRGPCCAPAPEEGGCPSE
jgi:hypothetical protein